ncbi:hypothetical protein Ahy_A09g044330 [Arachis hypogaea]|uniref:Uncharacterized protein n=1 Tax=Arachis hypogaea TaxID=3818 RepID=A0A445BJU9_ARAHY|nr:hypothetical protein Ahy_A09g044330 [Arachis hypogaea]
MKDSSSNKLNENDLDYCSETNHAEETSCVVDEKFVPKVGMIFKTLEEAGKFYKHYFKLAGFSTKIRNMTRDGDKIKNQLITRQVLKQHRELSMFVHCTIETNEEARIRPSKTYQSFLATASSHRELSFIEKDVRNYITREIRNISKQEDAKEFGKYLLRMKEKNRDFFFELNLEGDHCIKHAFWADTRSRAAYAFDRNWNDFLTKYSLRGNKWLSAERVDNMAPKYILECWSKNIKKSIQDEPLLHPRSKRFDELVFHLHNICEFASESEELTGILHRVFDMVMAEMQEYQMRSKEKGSLSHEEATFSDVNDF